MANASLAPIREHDYAPTIVATSGGCLVDDPIERTRNIVKATVKLWRNNNGGETQQGVITTIQPDSASTFISVGHELCMSRKMTPSHLLYSKLRSLLLFCLFCGDRAFENIALGGDMKHALKRTRYRMTSCVGCQPVSARIMGDTLKHLILDSEIASPSEVQLMFAHGYVDAMNVPAAVLFMKTIAKLADIDPSSFCTRRSTYESIRQDITLLATICGLMVDYITDINLVLEERLKMGTVLMAILFVCYQRNQTSFLPAQNYASWQRLLRSHYWSVATCQERGISEYLFFQDAGDALEQMYNLVRSCCKGAKGNGTGMDLQQLGERLGGVMEIVRVYSRKPHLQPKSRHLSVTDDHMNPGTFLATKDGSQDRTRIDVSRVNFINIHMRGLEKAAKILKKAGFSDDEVDWKHIAEDKSVDFLRPLGEFVGVTESDNNTPPPPIFVRLPTGKTLVLDDNTIGPSTFIANVKATVEQRTNNLDFLEHSVLFHGKKLEDEQTILDCNIVMESTIDIVPLKAALLDDMVALEEAIGPAPKKEGSIPPSQSSIVYKGQEMSPAKLLRIILDPTLSSETSRVACNRGSVKSGTEVKESDQMSGDIIYAGEDPVVVLIDTSEGATIAVLTPEGFEVDGKKMESIQKSKFVGDTVVDGKLIAVTVVNNEVSWSINKRSTHKLTVLARHCLVINPEFWRVDSGNDKLMKGEYYVGTVSMKLLLEKLYNDYCAITNGGVVHRATKISFLPYRQPEKSPPFLIHDVSNRLMSSKSFDAKQRDKSAYVVCPISGCTEEFIVPNMRLHVAFHYYHNRVFNCKSNINNGRLCGACGCSPAMSNVAVGSDLGCPVWIEGKTPMYTCQFIPYANFSIGAASKCTKTSPCTNRPIICPTCPKPKKGRAATFIWSYGASYHFQVVHPSVEMPRSFAKAVAVSEKEIELLKAWGKTKKRRRAIPSRSNSSMMGVNSFLLAPKVSSMLVNSGDKVGDSLACANTSSKQDPTYEIPLLRDISDKAIKTANALILAS